MAVVPLPAVFVHLTVSVSNTFVHTSDVVAGFTLYKPARRVAVTIGAEVSCRQAFAITPRPAGRAVVPLLRVRRGRPTLPPGAPGAPEIEHDGQQGVRSHQV